MDNHNDPRAVGNHRSEVRVSALPPNLAGLTANHLSPTRSTSRHACILRDSAVILLESRTGVFTPFAPDVGEWSEGSAVGGQRHVADWAVREGSRLGIRETAFHRWGRGH